jgi:hypothetical protein
MNERLAAKVKATNNAHRYAMELHNKLAPIFADLVGHKLTKQDGSLMAKFEKLLPEFPCTSALHVYRGRSDYSLYWMVKTCEVVNGTATYYEIGCYVGELRDGVLTKICNRPELRTDYTVEEVEANRKAYEEAAKVADEAKGKLYPFGEYDR